MVPRFPVSQTNSTSKQTQVVQLSIPSTTPVSPFTTQSPFSSLGLYPLQYMPNSLFAQGPPQCYPSLPTYSGVPAYVQPNACYIPIAPKRLPETHSGNKSSDRESPSFLETIKAIRDQLYEKAGLDGQEEPPEGEIITKWRRDVNGKWPVSYVNVVYKLCMRVWPLRSVLKL